MAIRINRVYTRSGDDGSTGLADGSRQPKHGLRVSAYGEVDELNSTVGLVVAALEEPPYTGSPDAARVREQLGQVQQELFDLGGELATPPGSEREDMARIGQDQVSRLEGWIDELQAELSELKSFVLPGGGTAGALLHLARTVCRRAERSVCALLAEDDGCPGPLGYLNRLSDLLFVQARWMALKSGKDETLWLHGLGRTEGGKPRGDPGS
ncbi:MAG: cob(I)yrinic acid a,c-diamide adenosyltransferase [Candidatus Binatia bacterium]